MSKDNGHPSSVRLVKVTPAQATKWLRDTIKNRQVRRAKVRQFAADMKAGKWHVTSETIKFSADGMLIDGQHRLLACIEADTPFETYVAKGIDITNALLAIDGGTPRSMADFLGITGYSDPALLAAAVRVANAVLLGQPHRSKGREMATDEPVGSRRVCVEWLGKHKAVFPIVQAVGRHRKDFAGVIPTSVIAGVATACAMVVDIDLAEEFVIKMATGEGEDSNSPLLKVRNRFVRDAVSKGEKMPQNQKVYLLLKAWNYWVTGEVMDKVHLAQSDDQMILQILGPDETLAKQHRTARSMKRITARKQARRKGK